MSVAQPLGTPPPAYPTTPERNEVKVISHSTLFYWWPVWAVGFLMAFLTWIERNRLANVPPDSVAAESVEVTIKKAGGEKETLVGREVIVLPKEKRLHREKGDPSAVEQPRLLMSHSKTYGVIFLTVLLLVVVFTNVPLRGMWSYVVIGVIVMVSLILHIFGAWPWLVEKMNQLDVRINLGGYLFLSIALLLVWLFTLIFFDRQIYMIFTPGQLKVCTEIGGGEKVYDAVGMTMEKHRSDLFRHIILGLGSGDLVVRTSGAQAHVFEMPNVLFIGQKVRQIEEMMKRKVVLESK